MIFPSYFALNSVAIDGTLLSLPFEYRECVHMIAKVRSSCNIDEYFSYSQHMKDELYLDRASNVSKYLDTPNLKCDESIVCIRLAKAAKGKYEEIDYSSLALKALIKENILPKDTEILDYHFLIN